MDQGISQIVAIIIAAIVIIGGGIALYQAGEEEVVGPPGEEIMEEVEEEIEEPEVPPAEEPTPPIVEEEPAPSIPETPVTPPSEVPSEPTPTLPPVIPTPTESEVPEEPVVEEPTPPEPEITPPPPEEPTEPEVIGPLPQAETAYVINEIGGTISVIDVGTATVTQTVKIAEGGGALSGLHTIIASPDKSLLYVSDHRADNVIAVRISDLSVISEVAVGEAPNGLSLTPDGSKLYVANFDSNTVSVIDTATYTVTSTISVDRAPSDVTVTPDGTKAYVTHFYDAADDVTRILIIDTTTDAVTGEVSLPSSSRSREIVFSHDGTKAFVSVERSDGVSIINTVDNIVIKTISGLLFPAHIIMSRDGKFAYVVAETDRKGGTTIEPKVYAINVATEKLARQMSGFRNPRGIAETTDGKKFYVTEYNSDEIRIFDLDEDKVVTAISVGDSPRDVVIVPGS